MSKLAPIKISLFNLVSVAEQAGLNLTLSETPKAGFVEMRPIYYLLIIAADHFGRRNYQKYM